MYTRRAFSINLTPISSKRYRLNQQIRLPQVVVIDEQNKHLGVMDTSRALALAQERGYDLVEIAPMARPPVCKLLDFGAFLFRQEKQERKAKAQQKKVDIKGIRLGFKISDHDETMRKNQALKFLDNGHKVMVEMRLRGRENAHRELAKKQIMEFIATLGTDVIVEQQLSQMGNRLIATVGRKK